MKPIDTRYAGHRFRSRLEARWAVFFDAAGVPWQYEPQGFEVGADKRWYLPDFYLPESSTWVEVKPIDDYLDMGLIRDCMHPESGLPDVTGSAQTERGLLILGQIPRHEFLDLGSRVIHPIAQADVESRGVLGFLRFFNGGVSVEEFSVDSDPPGPLAKAGGNLVDGRIVTMVSATSTSRIMWRIGDERVTQAYATAREARFEHGETPTPGNWR